MRSLLVYLLSKYAQRSKSSVLLLLLTLCAVAYPVAFSYSFQYLIDEILTPARYGRLPGFLLILAAGAAAAAAAEFLADYLLIRMGQRMQDELRFKLFGHLQLLPESYYRSQTSSAILNRLSGDLASVHASFLSLHAIVAAVLGMLASFALLLSMNGTLFALLLAGLPVCLLLPRLMSGRVLRINDEYKTQDEFNRLIMDRLKYHQTVRAYGLRSWEFKRLAALTERLNPLGVRAQFYRSAMGKSVGAALTLLNVAVLAAGAYFVHRGAATVGALVALQSFYLRIGGYASSLTRLFPAFVQGQLAYDRIERVILRQRPDPAELEAAAAEAAGPEDETSGRGNGFEGRGASWELREVSFRYSPNDPALADVRMTLPWGSVCAIVGSSGSGKSSIASLLMRFFEPERGAIFAGGRDIREIPLDAYRKAIGYVSQEIVLIDGTLRDNIRLGRPDATDFEIEEAAREACIHDWIVSLPDGYDSVVGERGRSLSGGEKQRIALARALVRRPALLLLDEVTSMLDPGAESAVNASLGRLAGSATVVTVTHRLQAIRSADRIFVTEKGRIVGSGTHADLLETCAAYSSLWHKQSGFSVSEDGRYADISSERLRQLPLFRMLDDRTLEEIRSSIATVHSEPGTTVLRQGDYGDSLYIIARGQVEVVLEHESQTPNRVAVLEDGDYFGEMALLGASTRTSSVRTLTRCVFLVMNRKPFQRALDAVPRFREEMEKAYAHRLEELHKLQERA